MTYQPDSTLPSEILEKVTESGLECLPDLLRIIFNAAMTAEREKYLGAAPYQRSPERRDHANGFKPKTVKTRVGEIQFNIPQVRQGDFYPQALEKGLRSERALHLALAEMYIQGVSTRKVSAILEELCGLQISSAQVSQATQALDETLHEWRERPLGACPYLLLDARYEKVRDHGQIRDAAVLIAFGVTPDGKRRILGVSVSLGEHEIHWRSFLQHLVERGLASVQLIVSDDHTGLKAARQAVFGGVPWQRCQFHLQQNAQAYVPRIEPRAEVGAEIRKILNAPNRATAEAWLKQTVEKYAQTLSRLAAWLENDLPEGFMVFDFPLAHQRRLCTVNGLERVNREIDRRTRVVSIFPNETSCLRLITALLMEIDEAWQLGKIYLTMGADSPQ